MPPLLFIGAIAAGGYLAWKALRQEMKRLDEQDARAKVVDRGRSLKKDPETGKYKPGQDDQENGKK